MGLVASRSTGQRKLQNAIVAAENMVRDGGRRASLSDTVLSDQEFVAIQKAHFGRKTDERAKQRAKRSLDSCLEAIAAFREITGLQPITLATPDDCANFQRVALTLPNMWRRVPAEQRRQTRDYSDDARERRRQTGTTDDLDECPGYSPNNVLKWSRSLQAAFERCNRNAFKRKCVRGVVDEKRLLTSNPWSQFTWIEGRGRPIRDSLRLVGKEVHFEVLCKWGIERWFRIPESLYQELLGLRTECPFIFAAYCEQVRKYHEDMNPGTAKSIREVFTPKNFARWFYHRVKEWAVQSGCEAYVHVFRKTALQLAWDGEDEVGQRVAEDASVSQSVLLGHYVKPKLWRKSNRTYHRILASLLPEVASRYGFMETPLSALERKLEAARADKDWPLVAELAAKLAQEQRCEAG
jgi:hypothetical protein